MEQNRVVAGIGFLFLAALVLVIGLDCGSVVKASPVERIAGRVRVLDDGKFGHLRLGGIVDSVRYLPGGTMSARRDSAQLWIQTETLPPWPADTLPAPQEPWAFRVIDGNGNGHFEWTGRVVAFGLWRDTVTIDGDKKRKWQQTPPMFHDDTAYIRATYAMGEMVSITAWGTETLMVPDAAGYGVDV